MSKVLNSSHDSARAEDLRWGWRSFRPRCLQWLNSSPGLLIVLILCNIFYGVTVNGFNFAAIPSLEKQFHFNSKQTGALSSVSDVSNMVLTVIVSFYGSFGNKPRWIGFSMILIGFSLVTFSFPHFLIGRYDPPEAVASLQFCPKYNTTSKCHNMEKISFTWSYYIVFLLAQVMAGAGGAPMFSLCIAYLDENVKPKYTSLFIALYYVSGFLGPSVGFVIAGQLLSLYVDIEQPDGFKLTPMDPRWIGNWWIGSLVGAFVIFPMSLVIIGFPRQLPHVRAQREKAIMNKEIPARDQDIRGKVKDIIPATKRLLSNPVYVFQSLGVWAQVVLGSGVGPFLYKLIRIHYGATQALAGLGVGMIVGISSACGTLIGSCFGSKVELKRSCKVAAKYCFFLQLFGMWMTFMFLVPGCDDIKVPDVRMTSSCKCDGVKYVPVCHDNITFYSACHAGCPHQKTTSMTYSNCTLGNYSGSNEVFQMNLGVCDRNCKNVYTFFVGFTLLLTLSYLNDIPGKVVTIRSVSENQRSYALGLQLVLWRAVGSLPAPVVFGSFIDKSCLLWRESCGTRGDCLAYKTGNVVHVIITSSLILQGVPGFTLGALVAMELKAEETEIDRKTCIYLMQMKWK
ncbi:solute carrier organic anion transporter family member 4A1-like isoform X2 [Xenia sp. Carnegie-2017]|uniref:solute carrier organic anion transporter family member 4A1-like isoform X2 n=1 Tax=Xenia sp. Carnegie-2017 TaxID=2897299 RepID=UPI001F036AB4|nr:solute carrier organic anion transporter family member 4A1-like isoform X2 [Xenia sp. Carnegie-2017]